MILDGAARVLICGGKNTGKKTFASAFLNVFTQYVFFGRSSDLYICLADRNMPRLNDEDKIDVHAQSAEFVTKSMSLDQAFKGQIEKFRSEIEFQLIIDNEFCGRIKLLNILGDLSGLHKEITEHGITTVVVIADGEYLERSDYSSTKDLLEQIREIQPGNYPFSVLVAVSKVDLIGVENTQKVSFFEKCTGFSRIAAFCSENGIPCRFTSFSAAGSNTSMVFDDGGNLVSNPDYRPWNVETVGLSIISSALPILKTQYTREQEKYISSIKKNRGIFNSDSFRSEMELQFSRAGLASAVQGLYQLDKFSRYSRQIVEHLNQKVFMI